MRETITLDFDGVLHQYTTPYERHDIIPDPPVHGSIEFLLKAMKHYNIAIFSARSHQLGGIPAMQNWLRRHLVEWISDVKSLKNSIEKFELAEFTISHSEDMDVERLYWADRVINDIMWPVNKLPSKLYIDDNGYRFNGIFPTLTELDKLQSWVKK